MGQYLELRMKWHAAPLPLSGIIARQLTGLRHPPKRPPAVLPHLGSPNAQE